MNPLDELNPLDDPKPEIRREEKKIEPKVKSQAPKWLIWTSIIQIVLLIFIAFQMSDWDTPTAAVVADQPAPAQAAAAPSIDMEKLIRDSPSLGEDDAPVTIAVFSDFSCPFCAAAAGENQQVIEYLQSRDPSWEAPVPNIIKEYVETGKVKLVFKYFPGHGTGGEAMKLAWCADEQGKFWEVHDAFFANQGDIENVAKLKTLAAGAGADLTELEKCYSSNKYASKLTSSTSEGRTAGVQGTPAFVVNGRMLSGAQSFAVFKQVIEAELK